MRSNTRRSRRTARRSRSTTRQSKTRKIRKGGAKERIDYHIKMAEQDLKTLANDKKQSRKKEKKHKSGKRVLGFLWRKKEPKLGPKFESLSAKEDFKKLVPEQHIKREDRFEPEIYNKLRGVEYSLSSRSPIASLGAALTPEKLEPYPINEKILGRELRARERRALKKAAPAPKSPAEDIISRLTLKSGSESVRKSGTKSSIKPGSSWSGLNMNLFKKK